MSEVETARLLLRRWQDDDLEPLVTLFGDPRGGAVPERRWPPLAAIKQASNDALGELRSVLDALRQVDDEPPRAPTPGLAGLAGLVAKATASGLLVRTELQGTPRPLTVAVDLAAFRIVQEALTNVTRHAAGATATVRVTYGARELTVQVDDDGGHAAAGPAPGGGSGISGMRERAVALGGELEAGPRSEGGFRILARPPLTGGGKDHADEVRP